MNACACHSLLLRSALALITVPGWFARTEAQQTATEKPPFRDAAVHRDLVAAFEKSQSSDPISNLGPAVTSIEPARVWAPESLEDRSEILNYQGLATLLPKGALLHLPEKLAVRSGLGEGDEAVVNWPEFFRRNSQWIFPLKVRLEQALGKEPIDEALISRLAKSGKVVIATYFDQPISVRPHAVELASTETGF